MTDFYVVKKSLATYLEAEMLNKINGWQAWVIGAFLSIVLEKGANIFDTLKENELINAMGIIKDNKIDIDLLYKHFLAQAKKHNVTFSMPLIGDVTFNAEDIEKLYAIIQSNKEE